MAPSNDLAFQQTMSIQMVNVRCPLCASDHDRPWVSTRDFIHGIDSPEPDGMYHYVACVPCGHIYLNPRPADESLVACYPKDYGPHRAVAVPESTPGAIPPWRLRVRALPMVPQLKRFLFWLGQQHATVIPPLPGQHDSNQSPTDRSHSKPRLLEIGCASGGFLGQAAQAGWFADGIETNPDAAALAQKLGYEVRTTMLAQSNLPDASRDAIASWMVLEHVPDPRETIQECFRVLRSGGWLGISVPDGGTLERRIFGRHWIGYEPPRHLQIFTAGRLVGLLNEVGFVDVHVRHQASLRYGWGSIAAWGMDRWPDAKWPRSWMTRFIGEPPRWLHWLMVVPEKVLSVMHQTGRITVTARKPDTIKTQRF